MGPPLISSAVKASARSSNRRKFLTLYANVLLLKVRIPVQMILLRSNELSPATPNSQIGMVLFGLFFLYCILHVIAEFQSAVLIAAFQVNHIQFTLVVIFDVELMSFRIINAKSF